jgi:chloramphenicol-sensitive protein RarD
VAGKSKGEHRIGLLNGFAAYGMWGLVPLFWPLLKPAGAVEILAHRMVWSLVVVAVALLFVRRWAWAGQLLRQPRRLGLIAVAAAVITVNWGVYIWSVNSGHVVEASLGYFINPLVTVLLGVLVLRERLRPWQWAAVGIGAAAVAVLTVAYGRPPLIALTLALSFGLYGLIKNRVGAGVGAVTSLTTETIVLALPAGIVLAWLEATGNGHFTQNPPWQGLLLASVGIATVVTLLFFAASARRVPLSTLGLLQYLTPTLQLLCGVLLLGEHMPPSRWAGFALVWVALVVLTADTLRSASRRRVEARTPEPVGAV